MNDQDRLFKFKMDRQGFGNLAIGSASVGTSTPLVVDIPAPGAGWVIVPFNFHIQAQAVGCRFLSSLLANPVIEDLDARTVRIARTDDQGVEAFGTDTPMRHNSEFDRSNDLVAEVQAISGSSLENKGLRMTFNGINSTYEMQYAYCVYKIIGVMDD